MINEQDYKRMLGEAKSLIRCGSFAEARDLLRQIQANELGKDDALTALGLPRRLQSALLKLAKAEGDAVARSGYQVHLVPPPQTLARYGVFSPAEQARMVELSRVTAPRCIHQIWLGSRPVPPTVDAWAAHARANGYRHKLWREADLAENGYDRHTALHHMLQQGDFPGAVDVARYMILRDLGGIYLDCDWYPASNTGSFHDFLPLRGLSVFAEEIPRNTGAGSTLFANSFIATPAGNPVFSRLCEALPSVIEDLGDAPAWWSTGPLIFTVVARSGPVSLAGAGFVAPSALVGASLSDVQVQAADTQGLLIAWKPW